MQCIYNIQIIIKKSYTINIITNIIYIIIYHCNHEIDLSKPLRINRCSKFHISLENYLGNVFCSDATNIGSLSNVRCSRLGIGIGKDYMEL